MMRSEVLNSDAEHVLVGQVREMAMRRGRTLARAAAEGGLAVTEIDGSSHPIPIGAIPVILSEEEIAKRGETARHLLGAVAKTARWRMSAEPAEVLDALSASERRVIAATWKATSHIAVARVDFLGSETLSALEVNATIPAMQGYSDIAAESWLTTFAAGNPDLAAMKLANGSNTKALLDSLIGIYAAHRNDTLHTIGILCRRGDAQHTELRYIQSRFRNEGFAAKIVHLDELVLRRGYLEHEGRRIQLIYRHLFLNRLDRQPAPDLEAVLAANACVGTLVLNPAAPHLEMKSTFALLSRAVDVPQLVGAVGLDESECNAVVTSVPWTRSFVKGGELDSRLFADVVSAPDQFVLKRSWSYGGNEVFIGRARESSDFWERVHKSYPDINRWEDLCTRATEDSRGGGFVVQRAVELKKAEQYLCTPDSVQRTLVTTDYAAFTSLGSSPAWSGVCRAAASDVVNIVGGGGLVPILRREVADQLAAASPLCHSSVRRESA